MMMLNRNNNVIAIIQYMEGINQNNNNLLTLLECFEGNIHIRVEDFYERWIDLYLDYDFFQLFRLTKQTVADLLIKLDLGQPHQSGLPPVVPHKQLLMALWWLGKGESLLSVSDKFNVSVSTVFACTERVIHRLTELNSKYISWPKPHELHSISQSFLVKGGYPGNAF